MGDIGQRKIGVRVTFPKQVEAIFKAFISTELSLSGHVFVPQAIDFFDRTTLQGKIAYTTVSGWRKC